MPNIQHKRRTSPGPPASLLPGQIAVADGASNGAPALYYGCTDGTIQAVTTGGGSGGGSTITLENVDTVDLAAGMAVQIGPAGTGMVRWDGSRQCLGLSSTNVAQGFAGPVQSSGGLTLGSWVASTGFAALTSQTMYADPSNPGFLTAIQPVSGVLQVIGQPVSSEALEIMIQPPILL